MSDIIRRGRETLRRSSVGSATNQNDSWMLFHENDESVLLSFYSIKIMKLSHYLLNGNVHNSELIHSYKIHLTGSEISMQDTLQWIFLISWYTHHAIKHLKSIYATLNVHKISYILCMLHTLFFIPIKYICIQCLLHTQFAKNLLHYCYITYVKQTIYDFDKMENWFTFTFLYFEILSAAINSLL